MLFFGFVFGCIFGGLWLHCWCHFGRYWEVVFDNFPDFLKYAGPHASAVNTGWIEGRAPDKTTKMLVKNMDKIRRENEEEKGREFGQVLARFWEAFGTIVGGQTVFKNRMKIWRRF